MRRRALVAGMTALAAGSGVRAQGRPVVGFLYASTNSWEFARDLRRGLAEQGFGENDYNLEPRSGQDKAELLAPLARELVEKKVNVIVATGGSAPARAAKQATDTIPIVFVSAADPLRAALVTRLNRPGGNVTGVSLIGSALEAKRIEYLARAIKKPGAIAALVDPTYPDADLQKTELKQAADAVGRPIDFVLVSREAEFEPAIAAAVARGAVGLAISQGPSFNTYRTLLVSLAARFLLPAIYNQRQFPDSGGLMSYGPSFGDGYRQGGVYAGRILKGARPADLPVVQAARFEFVINLRTARALGLELPSDLLGRADEVIE
jgi:putative tryptophan/tyrosine transport system substrate-binding protein